MNNAVLNDKNQPLAAVSSPFVMVIFGITGDLAQNKLMPALFSLFNNSQLPEEFFIVGFSRRDLDDNGIRNYFPKLSNQKNWDKFKEHLTYQQGTFEERKGYLSLIDRLKKFDDKMSSCITRIFYLATPPPNYRIILDNLYGTKLSEGCGQGANKWTKIIVEKPFGKDLETARDLDKRLGEIFAEKQIFRVDHYLGKETVQNILAFRFANGIFEPVWNNNYIDHVQITWAEEKGINNRGKFFEGVGLLRDIAQNHLMQLLASVTMESPKSFMKEDIRDARASAIKAIRCIEEKDVSKFVVRGQYEEYGREKDVDKNSLTETFVALKLFIDTPRFSGVPFYVRAGEKMPKNIVEISIVFKQTCHILFKEYGCPETGNVLTIRIQPDEGISMKVIAKKPGIKLSLDTINMKFSYKEGFGVKVADAYEKILLDIFAGDQTLFNRSDELNSSWKFITKILDGWKSKGTKPLSYKSGSWGPEEAEGLIANDNKVWL